MVTPDKPQYRDGAFGGANPTTLLQSFRSTWGWTTKYKTTAKTSSTVWARWDPQLVASGWYEVSVFVPARHATTTRARYKLHGVLGASSELEIPVRAVDAIITSGCRWASSSSTRTTPRRAWSS